jgi:hypothetical protein
MVHTTLRNTTFQKVFKGSTVDDIKKKLIENPGLINKTDTNLDTILTWLLKKPIPDPGSGGQNTIKYFEFAREIIDGNPENYIDLDEKNYSGETVVKLAIEGTSKSTYKRLLQNIVKDLLNKGVIVDDSDKNLVVTNRLSNEIVGKLGRLIRIGPGDNCTKFITDKKLLQSTSSHAGYPLCNPKSTYFENFLESCVVYYADKDNLENLIYNKTDSIGINITKKSNELEEVYIKYEKNKNLVQEEIVLSTKKELKNLIRRYKILKDLYDIETTSERIKEATNLVSYYFTSWIKFIFPLPDTQRYKDLAPYTILELMNNSDMMMMKNYNFGDTNSSIYKKMKKVQGVKFHNAVEKITSTGMTLLFQIIYHMIYYFNTPDDVIRIRVSMAEKYNILEFSYFSQKPIQDQELILTLIDELQIKRRQDDFPNIYRIPIDIVKGETKIIIPDRKYDNNLKNIELGIHMIISIMESKFNVGDAGKDKYNSKIGATSTIRSKLDDTDGSRASFIFTPTPNIFSKENDYGRTNIYYTFYDILCGQIFQEYREKLDIEHIMANSRLQFLTDFSVTRPVNEKGKKYFDVIFLLIKFALQSFFIQNNLTSICNRAAGAKPRWSQTLDQFSNLLTFIGRMYWCKNHHSGTDFELVWNERPGKKLDDYIKAMIDNTNKIQKSKLNPTEVNEFMNFPTLLLPEDDLFEEITSQLNRIYQSGNMLEDLGEKVYLLFDNDYVSYVSILETSNDVMSNTQYIDNAHVIIDRVTTYNNRLGFGTSKNLAKTLSQTINPFVFEKRVKQYNNLAALLPIDNTFQKLLKTAQKNIKTKSTPQIKTYIYPLSKLFISSQSQKTTQVAFGH